MQGGYLIRPADIPEILQALQAADVRRALKRWGIVVGCPYRAYGGPS